MNKISPLDIRVAVVAYPLVNKDELESPAFAKRPIVPFSGDERIVSLFQNSPKPRIEQSKSKMPPLIRKGQYVLIRILEILKTLLEPNETSSVLNDIAPPRKLLVPQLPYPRFQAAKPPRFFWHPSHSSPKDEYAPSCLMSEVKEDLPSPIYNSASISAYARAALPQKGILRQDHEGFVYLELPDEYITELSPLIHDPASETVPLYYLEPSPAHIPVILPHEWAQRKGWGELKDLDKSFSFKINGVSSLNPKRWPGVEKVYFLRISSPELEKFRERCLLPSRIRGHEFHVAIAYKKADAAAMAVPKKETFRLNVSCFAA
ncbi:MAG: hypothetical protein JSS60_02505 [Verrucomicrobia bacterium]|nr:hypothetical protein [Verrucomicrobiota bacterium]